MTDDQIDEIVKSKKFFQTELIDDHDGDPDHDRINDDDDIRHDIPHFGPICQFWSIRLDNHFKDQ